MAKKKRKTPTNEERCHLCREILDNPGNPLSKGLGGYCLTCVCAAGNPEARAAVGEIREQMLCRIMAYDISAILDDARRGRFDYVSSILSGEGYTVPGKMSSDELLREWLDGDYGGKIKKRVMANSPAYQDHAYIRQLWDDGDSSGLFDDQGFHAVGSPEWLAMKARETADPPRG